MKLREGLLAALMPLVPRARAGRGAGGLDPGGGGELGLQQLTCCKLSAAGTGDQCSKQ